MILLTVELSNIITPLIFCQIKNKSLCLLSKSLNRVWITPSMRKKFPNFLWQTTNKFLRKNKKNKRRAWIYFLIFLIGINYLPWSFFQSNYKSEDPLNLTCWANSKILEYLQKSCKIMKSWWTKIIRQILPQK